MWRSQTGLTLVELLLGLAVLAIAAFLAIGGFDGVRRDAGIAANASEMLASLNLARGAARTRGVSVAVCQSADGERCVLGPGQSTRGWLAFVNRDGGQASQRETGEELLGAWRTAPQVWLRGTRAAVVYWPTPRTGTTATLTFCDPRDPARARAVIVSQTGRPRLSPVSAEGGPLTCGQSS